MPPRLAPYVKLREVARLMGWGTSRNAIQRLTRKLIAKQALTGEAFLLKLGTADHSPWLTTFPQLRKHCPELFDKPAEGLDMLAEAAAALRAEMTELRNANKDLRARIGSLERQCKAMQSDPRAA